MELVRFLSRHHRRLEIVFPPARLSRRILRRLRRQVRSFWSRPDDQRAFWGAPLHQDALMELRRKSRRLSEKLDAMPPTVEQRLQETGVAYRGTSGKVKVLQDLRYHGVRYHAMSKMLPLFRSDVSGNVLEIGSNSGLLSLTVKAENPDLHCVAVDRCPKQIATSNILKEYLHLDVDFRVVEGSDTASVVGHRRFDYIFLCELLEHLPYGRPQQQILDEAVALCKPDGRIIVTVPYEDRIPSPGHITEFRRDNLRALLEPYARELVWHEHERREYDLERHFIASFAIKPKSSC